MKLSPEPVKWVPYKKRKESRLQKQFGDLLLKITPIVISGAAFMVSYWGFRTSESVNRPILVVHFSHAYLYVDRSDDSLTGIVEARLENKGNTTATDVRGCISADALTLTHDEDCFDHVSVFPKDVVQVEGRVNAQLSRADRHDIQDMFSGKGGFSANLHMEYHSDLGRRYVVDYAAYIPFDRIQLKLAPVQTKKPLGQEPDAR